MVRKSNFSVTLNYPGKLYMRKPQEKDISCHYFTSHRTFLLMFRYGLQLTKLLLLFLLNRIHYCVGYITSFDMWCTLEDGTISATSVSLPGKSNNYPSFNQYPTSAIQHRPQSGYCMVLLVSWRPGSVDMDGACLLKAAAAPYKAEVLANWACLSMTCKLCW